MKRNFSKLQTQLLIFCIITLTFVLQAPHLVTAEEFDIYPADCGNSLIRLTDDTNRVQSAYSISGSNFAWAQENILDYDIFLWDGTSIRTLTNNGTGFDDMNPDVDGNGVVWQGYDGNDEEIFYYDGTTTVQISNNSIPDRNADISGNSIVWQGYSGFDTEIFYYDGTTTTQITSNSNPDTIPEISGTNITWNGFDGNDWEVFYYDGATVTQITNNNFDEQVPQIEGNYVVWDGVSSGVNRVYLWDGTTTTVLGTNTGSVPHIADGKVVWADSNAVHYWDIATSSETVIDFIGASTPKVSDEGVLWIATSQHDIYFWDGTQILQITNTRIWTEFYNLLSGTHAIWNVLFNGDEDVFYVNLSNCQAIIPAPSFASIPALNSTIPLTGETGTTQFATLSISNIGDVGSLLDVSQVGILSNFSISTLPQDLSPADGAVTIEISCVVPQASETLVLQTNETGNPTYSYTLECIANDPTPEITVEPTEEVTPEVTPEITVEPTEEVTPEVTPEVTVEPTEEVTPEITAEPTEEVTPEITVEPTEEVTPEITAEPTEEITPEITPEVTPEPDSVTICHVAGLADDAANYLILELPLAALNGHFDNNGTPLAGHEDDFLIVTTEDAANCAADIPEATNEPEVDVDENQSSNAPQISVFDPAISKIGFLLPGQVGVTGEQLEWVVTVSNTGSVAGQNVVVTDTLIDALRVDSVNAPGAVVSISGQTVTVTYPILNIGETRQFSIITTVLQGVEVSNTACVNATNQTNAECATGNAIVSLPQTGENPFWRNWLWLLAIVPLTGLVLFRRKHQL